MRLRHKPFRASITIAAAVTSTLVALTGCGGGDGSRTAKAVSASTSGVVVTTDSTDLGSIVIGWGEKHSDAEITTPKPDEVTARCSGNGDGLTVEISAPHGWQVTASKPSQVLTVSNTEQKLSGRIDTTNRYLDTLKAVDWSETDQLDISATADAPKDWHSPYGAARVYLALHVDCR
ncbi:MULTISPECIES: hypothetical protein [unclassified Nocardia]|uniref:hypothetical protein n=1 Tax=unclassified Nocardia TaxID=2637762 RepID=UPI001CE4A0EC|nr:MULTISPECIES: hypothetical protein [unclassified Nocardia]